MSKIYYLSLVVLILVSASVCAEFDTYYEVVDNNINFDLNEYAEFKLTIVNTGGTQERVVISSQEADRITWDVKTKPLSDYIQIIDANSQKTTTLLLKPVRYKTPLEYVTVTVKSEKTGVSKTQTLGVGISREPVPGYYIPIVDIITKVSDTDTKTLLNEVDPRDPFIVSVELVNKNPLNITSMKVTIKSELLGLDEVKYTTLEPWQTKTVYYQYNINPLMKPSSGSVDLKIEVENKTLSQVDREIKIITYSDIEKNVVYDENFLKNTENNILTNKGNVDKESFLSVKAPFLWKFVVDSSLPYRVEKEDRETYLVWDYELAPLETRTIDITYNYRPLTIFFTVLVLLIVLSIYLYYTLRSDLVISKAASGIGTSEGGISELKILIHVKNRTDRTVSNVKITDRVPKLANLDPSFEGTLKPTKVLRNDKVGSAVKWSIETLDPFEERVLTYKVQSKLSILGGMTLPQTSVAYRDEKDNDRTTKSNKLNVTLHKHLQQN